MMVIVMVIVITIYIIIFMAISWSFAIWAADVRHCTRAFGAEAQRSGACLTLRHSGQFSKVFCVLNFCPIRYICSLQKQLQGVALVPCDASLFEE